MAKVVIAYPRSPNNFLYTIIIVSIPSTPFSIVSVVAGCCSAETKRPRAQIATTSRNEPPNPDQTEAPRTRALCPVRTSSFIIHHHVVLVDLVLCASQQETVRRMAHVTLGPSFCPAGVAHPSSISSRPSHDEIKRTIAVSL